MPCRGHILKYNHFFRFANPQAVQLPEKAENQNETPSLKPALFRPPIPNAPLLFVAWL